LFAFNDAQISALVAAGIEKAKKELQEEESKKQEDMKKMLGQLKVCFYFFFIFSHL